MTDFFLEKKTHEYRFMIWRSSIVSHFIFNNSRHLILKWLFAVLGPSTWHSGWEGLRMGNKVLSTVQNEFIPVRT